MVALGRTRDIAHEVCGWVPELKAVAKEYGWTESSLRLADFPS